MPSEMRALGEFVDIKHGFAFSGKHIVSNENDRILLTPGHFEIGGGFRHNHKKYYDSNGYKSEYELEPGELIVSMTDLSKEGDTLGYSAIIPKIDGKILLHNQRIGKVIFKDEKLDKGFCHYLMRDRVYRQHILATCTGSTVKHTSPTKILDFRFILPEKSDQKAIAHILGTLDDKIELNQRMNQTLEDIAKAIFKSWFVDFDPVRAKAEGRPTGLLAEISDLFPDAFEDSEIGEIPRGWTRRCLGALVTPQRGKTITKSKCVVGGIPVVAGGLSPAYYHNVANVSAPVVTISASGANAGFARLYHEDIWASDCSYISKRQSRFVYIWYIFLKMHQSKIYHMQQGAAQPHIYPSDLMRMEVVCPEDETLWHHLDTIVSPMFERISICERQNKVLAELRDTLLPKLISGELRIPDAEKFLEEAGV